MRIFALCYSPYLIPLDFGHKIPFAWNQQDQFQIIVFITKTLTGIACLNGAFLGSGCYQKVLRNRD